MMQRSLMLAVVVLLLPACSVLQQWLTPPPPCETAPYRQFDFWLGQWDVVKQEGGTPQASSHISSILQGCGIKEQYQAQTGYAGESLNWYDPETAQWRQSWTDNAGMTLELSGGLNEQGQMVLSGDQRRDERGEKVRDRISWTAQPDGRVIQVWQSSTDGGQTWDQLFRGLYLPRHPQPEPTPASRFISN